MQGTAIAEAIDAPPLAEEIRSAARALGVTLRTSRLERGQVAELRGGIEARLHVLTEGQLKIVRFSSEGRALILELLDAGDLFGETSTAGEDDLQPTYAEALTAVRFETLTALDAERVLVARPPIALSLAKLMEERRRRAERRLERQIFQRVPTRLALQLLDLAERYGVPDAGGLRIGIRLSQQDLGGLIGASREIVSVTLTEFRRHGAVVSTGRQLVVRQKELEAIARSESF